MMTEKEFLKSQKECAEMLGVSLEEYHNSIKTIKVPKPEEAIEHEYDNTILEKLGISESMLKKAK